MYEVTRDTVREEVALVVHDTLREVTTITIRQNEAGDTLKVVQVTDRDRIRSKADVRSKKEVVRVERDTVYVERRDSILVKSEEFSPCERAELERRVKSSLRSALPLGSSKNPRPSALILTLKWIFWILIGLIGLIVTAKVCSLKR